MAFTNDDQRFVPILQREHGDGAFDVHRRHLPLWVKPANPDILPGLHTSDHLSTRQYARIVKGWVKAIGLDPAMYGTHTMRRTKASLIYRRTKNLRAVQLLLGHSKIESTVRYLGIEVDDAIAIAEKVDI